MSEQQQEPAFPPQHQDKQPGLEAEMTPRPQSEAKSYQAAGKLAGKAAIVSGGDSGIGKAVVIAFAKEGADVAILYKDEHEDAEGVKRLVEAEGRRCLSLAGDVGDETFVREAVEQAAREFGRLDVVVPNAGEQHVNEDFATIETAQVERTFRTNVFGTFFLIREALKHLKEGAAIVVTTSVTAFRGSPELVDYSATKGAQLAMVRSLANQLAEKSIRERRSARPDLDAANPGELRRRETGGVRTFYKDGPSRPAGRGRALLRVPSQPRQFLHDRTSLAPERGRDRRLIFGCRTPEPPPKSGCSETATGFATANSHFLRRSRPMPEGQTNQRSGTSKRGFASMDPERQREIARKGGASVPSEKRSFSQDRSLAAEAGRKGGEASHGGRARNRKGDDQNGSRTNKH